MTTTTRLPSAALAVHVSLPPIAFSMVAEIYASPRYARYVHLFSATPERPYFTVAWLSEGEGSGSTDHVSYDDARAEWYRQANRLFPGQVSQ